MNVRNNMWKTNNLKGRQFGWINSLFNYNSIKLINRTNELIDENLMIISITDNTRVIDSQDC